MTSPVTSPGLVPYAPNGVRPSTDSGTTCCRFPMQDVTPTTIPSSLALSAGAQFASHGFDAQPSPYYSGHIAMENAESVTFPELKRMFDKDERFRDAVRSLVQAETADALDRASVLHSQVS